MSNLKNRSYGSTAGGWTKISIPTLGLTLKTNFNNYYEGTSINIWIYAYDYAGNKIEISRVTSITNSATIDGSKYEYVYCEMNGAKCCYSYSYE